MNVTVKYFAYYRERVGKESERIQIDDGKHISDLIDMLKQRYPEVFNGNALFVARNFRYAEPGEVLSDGDVVAIMPHVSGG
ncbi:MoaD/ThiS family protein [Thermoplasma sp.]|uniref:MoaD/ThiS family protein n=1 Tax=Thermoplasma sp. TaxID=1973142 RepID=UPI0012875609|nr:MoaD family protein [Thermoplasma sp.]KAA8923023.1 MAG: MoaD family protein [Thermoplasma sp.]